MWAKRVRSFSSRRPPGTIIPNKSLAPPVVNTPITVVNVSNEEQARAFLSSPEGGTVILNHLTKNKAAARAALS